MKQTALKRDEEQVQAIVNNLNENMTDSFDIEAHPSCLMNGSLLSADIEGEKSAETLLTVLSL
jgi:hypothetical protein